METPLRDILRERIHRHEIQHIASLCSDDARKEELFTLISDTDPRVTYNALWILTHLSAPDRKWLESKRDRLINLLLSTTASGPRRLLLTILEQMPAEAQIIRTDYLDWCLSKINSTEPYAIRALSLKQAYIQSRPYPEIMRELLLEIELMDTSGPLPPGLRSARRNILRKIKSCNSIT